MFITFQKNLHFGSFVGPMEMSRWTHLLGAIKLSGPRRAPHRLCRPKQVSWWLPEWIPSKKRILLVLVLCILFSSDFVFLLYGFVLGHKSLSTLAQGSVASDHHISLNCTLSIHEPSLQESDLSVWARGNVSVGNRELFSVGWETTRKAGFSLFCFCLCKNMSQDHWKKQKLLWNLDQFCVFGSPLTCG